MRQPEPSEKRDSAERLQHFDLLGYHCAPSPDRAELNRVVVCGRSELGDLLDDRVHLRQNLLHHLGGVKVGETRPLASSPTRRENRCLAHASCAPVVTPAIRNVLRLERPYTCGGCPRGSDPMSARSSASSSRGMKRYWGGLNRGRSWRQENRSASQKKRQPWPIFSISSTLARTSPPANTGLR